MPVSENRPPEFISSSAGRTARLWLFLLVLGFLVLIGGSAFAKQVQVRPSALAGAWYPGEPEELTSWIKGFLVRARPPEISGRLKALITPHAGLKYSGQTAAYGYALLKGRDFETVVMVGPSHRARFSGVSLNTQDYETPLGRVPVDQDLAGRIIDAGGGLVKSRPELHAREHCLEIQLPFLQVVLGRFKIVPVLMGDQDLETCRRLGRTLARVLGNRKVLLLASTDLSHFHPDFRAQEMDGRLIELVRAFDPEALHLELARGRIEACGGGPLVVVMKAARALGADRAAILKYAHSGQVTGDGSSVVGYLSAALIETGKSEEPTAREESRVDGPAVAGLDLRDKQQLLSIARRAITCGLDGTNFDLPADLSPRLLSHCGAFVTLKRRGRLRGCIGWCAAIQPLAEVVARMAVQAAFYDSRFPPLTKYELEDDLRLEISVLTPLERVEDVQEIRVGVHGLMIVKGRRRGLLLPQVPLEQGWDREKFLEQTCLKAGLPPGAWKQGAELYSFTAQVFGEEGVKSEP